jgi:hypothetical protein
MSQRRSTRGRRFIADAGEAGAELSCGDVEIVIPSLRGGVHHAATCKDSLVNNCPSCKKVVAELKMSTIKAKVQSLPPFNCVTLCCPYCGAIVLAVPDLVDVGPEVSPAPTGH